MRVVDAVNEAREYRELFVRMMMERYPIDKQEIERMHGEQQKAYGNNLDFLLMVRRGTNDKVNIHKPDATWKACLRDDEGESLIPGKRRGASGEKARCTCSFCYGNTLLGPAAGAGPCAPAFPSWPKALLNKAPGDEPFRHVVTGVPGAVTMTWEDAGLVFFGNTPQPDNWGMAACASRSPGGSGNMQWEIPFI